MCDYSRSFARVPRVVSICVILVSVASACCQILRVTGISAKHCLSSLFIGWHGNGTGPAEPLNLITVGLLQKSVNFVVL